MQKSGYVNRPVEVALTAERPRADFFNEVCSRPGYGSLGINADLAEWHIRVFDDVCRHAVPEFVCFAEDMSYNHGPMLSQEQFDEFLAPCYRKVILPGARGGGFLIGCDHQTPPGVSYDDYALYIRLFKEHAVKASASG